MVICLFTPCFRSKVVAFFIFPTPKPGVTFSTCQQNFKGMRFSTTRTTAQSITHIQAIRHCIIDVTSPSDFTSGSDVTQNQEIYPHDVMLPGSVTVLPSYDNNRNYMRCATVGTGDFRRSSLNEMLNSAQV